uniref:Receptor expression-enhancing protein n=1 Tax=Cyprinus carpio TaxID=7962 RepID=A0A8C1SPJ9_CYPCA
MIGWALNCSLLFGTLYPAYYSFKAVKSKNVKEYVRWMMYWIVFALYTVVETITDLSLAWFPVYYELKMAFVFWLLSPYTRGASVFFRKCKNLLQIFLFPFSFCLHAKLISSSSCCTYERLRSFSIPDLTQLPSEQSVFSNPSRRALQPANPRAADSGEYWEGHEEETDGVFSEDEASVQKGLRRSQSVKLTRAKAARKEPRYGSLKLKPRRRQLITSSTFDHP